MKEKIDAEELEKKLWNAYFDEALKGNGQEQDRSNVWWKAIDDDLEYICQHLFQDKKVSLLEIGCGSGTNTFTLAKSIDINKITLIDISTNALEYAKKITPQELKTKTQYIELSAFNVDTSIKEKFDLVWNTGLIEHYKPSEIKFIIHNMLSALKDDGYILMGIPNIKSLAVLKASFLGTAFARKYLKFIGGYRNTTEKMYNDAFISKLILDNFNVNLRLAYAGSVSLVGMPRFLVIFLNKIFKRTPFSFLTYYILSKK